MMCSGVACAALAIQLTYVVGGSAYNVVSVDTSVSMHLESLA